MWSSSNNWSSKYRRRTYVSGLSVVCPAGRTCTSIMNHLQRVRSPCQLSFQPSEACLFLHLHLYPPLPPSLYLPTRSLSPFLSLTVLIPCFWSSNTNHGDSAIKISQRNGKQSPESSTQWIKREAKYSYRARCYLSEHVSTSAATGEQN